MFTAGMRLEGGTIRDLGGDHSLGCDHRQRVGCES